MKGMDNIMRFETISDYNAFNNTETLHPLVSVIDLSKAKPRQASNMCFGLYTVFLKEVKCGDLQYGKIPMTTRKEHWYLLHQDRWLALTAVERRINRKGMRWSFIQI